MKVSHYTEDGDVEVTNSKPETVKRYAGYVSFFLVLAGIVGGILYALSRPEDLDLTNAEGGQSGLSVVVFSNITGFDGSLIIQKSSDIRNASDVTYFLNLQGVEFPTSAVGNISLTFSNLSLPVDVFVVEDVANLEYPHMLPKHFDPFQYTGAIFHDDNDSVLGDVQFSTVDPIADTLFSTLTGSSYGISGTITMMKVTILDENNQLVERTKLLFNGITIDSAPGPFLYLSKDKRYDGSDLEVPIVGGETRQGKPGFFTVTGDFEQILDADIEFDEYENGRWIVW
eukprot:CAMPEP_0204829084 /NCGR_PEP_ID=MMETSP1346-20131115/7093_1 /ASSEMBLY_ACC=CAM_ASM_000771 /TAXON_ID=215587 /ORGANISM="Aplanochytrium stocchinoi, Strain GSBS06" /LENGTH=284 /DNA_ID=CAMNT_0051958595 /DNA_START=70 /DNA_END=921 /DNA_ORIENTATION=-